MAKVYFLLLLALGILSCNSSDQASQTSTTMATDHPAFLIGTYTQQLGHVNGKADGIYTIGGEQDAIIQATKGIENPSYLTVDPKNQYAYAVAELVPGGADSSGYIFSYQLGPKGELVYLNKQPSFGFAPCYVSISNDGKFVLAANYVGGKVAVYPILEDGSLGEASDIKTFNGSGPHPEQESSHPHCILSLPNSSWVYSADKGADRVMSFRLTSEGTLEPSEQQYLEIPAGSGPRHLAFHPSLPFAYLVNELNGTINVLAVDRASGSLNLMSTITTLPEDYDGFNACADIHISPDGKHLYASNRGHNSLAIYSIHPETGQLNSVGWEPTKGDFPRNFLIADDGQSILVANQNSDNIIRFKRNPENGLLTFEQELSCPTPVCIKAIKL